MVTRLRTPVLRCLLLACMVVQGTGCVARYVRMEEKGITCGAAQQMALDAVRRMGYTIATATTPTPSGPGMITASRFEGATQHGLLVRVYCTTLGAEVEAQSQAGGWSELGVTEEFKRQFATVQATPSLPRAAAPQGVDILLTLERSATTGLNVDFGSLGLLPVRVRITNRTAQAYRLRVQEVVLQTADGQRAKPVPLAEVLKRLGASTVEGVPGEAGRYEAVRQQALGDREIDAEETVTGFLFFPFNAYTRARVVLIERESGEPEGFAIEL